MKKIILLLACGFCLFAQSVHKNFLLPINGQEIFLQGFDQHEHKGSTLASKGNAYGMIDSKGYAHLWKIAENIGIYIKSFEPVNNLQQYTDFYFSPHNEYIILSARELSFDSSNLGYLYVQSGDKLWPGIKCYYNPTLFSFTEESKLLAVAAFSNDLNIVETWQITPNGPAWQWKTVIDEDINFLSLNPSGNILAVKRGYFGKTTLFSANSGEKIKDLEYFNNVTSHFHTKIPQIIWQNKRSADQLIVLGDFYSLIVDINSKYAGIHGYSFQNAAAASSNNGKFLSISVYDNSHIIIWDTDKKTQIASWAQPKTRIIEFSIDDSFLITNFDDKIKIFSIYYTSNTYYFIPYAETVYNEEIEQIVPDKSNGRVFISRSRQGHLVRWSF